MTHKNMATTHTRAFHFKLSTRLSLTGLPPESMQINAGHECTSIFDRQAIEKGGTGEIGFSSSMEETPGDEGMGVADQKPTREAWF
ncbi:MAG: hypothetical protein WBN90_04015 [Gammaproteobacteria bacterium]